MYIKEQQIFDTRDDHWVNRHIQQLIKYVERHFGIYCRFIEH